MNTVVFRVQKRLDLLELELQAVMSEVLRTELGPSARSASPLNHRAPPQAQEPTHS